MSLDKQPALQTRPQHRQRPLYEVPKSNPALLVLPHRPPGALPNFTRRPNNTMDAYPGYREQSHARSPQERTSWGTRDEAWREKDRAENPRIDTFYRGRSPGMF